MGEYADMIINGESCQECNVYMGEPVGYPRTCKGCRRIDFASTAGNRKPPANNSGKTNCPVCNKRVKLAGGNDHLRDSHYTYWEEKVNKK